MKSQNFKKPTICVSQKKSIRPTTALNSFIGSPPNPFEDFLYAGVFQLTTNDTPKSVDETKKPNSGSEVPIVTHNEIIDVYEDFQDLDMHRHNHRQEIDSFVESIPDPIMEKRFEENLDQIESLIDHMVYFENFANIISGK